MESIIEQIVKVLLVAVLAVAAILYWLLPKSRLAGKFRMNETLYVVTNVVGIVCGIIGLTATIVWPRYVIELHLWEFIMLLFVLVHVYWAIISRVRQKSPLLDEKQSFDMAQAAAITWAGSIPAMAVLFVLYDKGVLHGLMWFPFYLFATLLAYSISTLYLFRRA